MSKRGLTPKQERFVSEYLVDLNATAAAVRAGYSARNADKIGPRLVGESRVAAAIAAARQARQQRTQTTADDVLRGLRREAEFAGEGSSHGARVSAWGLLGKHLGMFVEQHQHKGEVVVKVLSGVTMEEV